MADFIICLIILLAAGLLLPVLHSFTKTRDHNYRPKCRSNLRQIIIAMTSYSDKDLVNGHFPLHPAGEEESFALLLRTDEISDATTFACPQYSRKYNALYSKPVPYPKLVKELHAWTLTHSDYAYYWKNGPISNSSYSNLAVVSDFSENHAEGGNVGFLDGHVRFFRNSNVDKIAHSGPFYDVGGILETTPAPKK